MIGGLLVLLTLPRFNRRDVGFNPQHWGRGIEIDIGDATHYINIIRHFRHEEISLSLKPPFTYRPLVPFLASRMPFDAMTSINLINVTASLIAMVFVYIILSLFGFGFPWRIVGCGMFTVSLPSVWYVSNGYVDAVLIALLTIGTYLIFSNRWLPLALLIFIGSFVKETIIILFPPLMAYLYFRRKLFTI
jgi:hypothetical protein